MAIDVKPLIETYRAYLGKINRANFSMDKLMDFLKEKDFFNMPASIKYHSSFQGGLAYHSLLVLNEYTKLIADLQMDIPKDSAIITSLLHDVCKIDTYERKDDEEPTEKQLEYLKSLLENHNKELEENPVNFSRRYVSSLIDWLKNKPEEKRPEQDHGWGYKESPRYPFKHGDKSVYLAEKFIDLKDREMLAIRFHMGAWEDSLTEDRELLKQYNNAKDKYPDVKLIAIADELATYREDWNKNTHLNNIDCHI
ncbi:hypothetical protein [Halarsenatibacter silvermanii]|uniref:HD domain-containing protein n=1 Tax=Halarsenatibacter silvermanii TaxID=321763 RepID=A0A1G9R3U8_9FIRM|nr:hypothetical protein [Halarsenatibacter silvermanii]SDM17939.1 hypothetical protein SAMN04488692_1202 [Halarsenatibacter silvermanii]